MSKNVVAYQEIGPVAVIVTPNAASADGEACAIAMPVWRDKTPISEACHASNGSLLPTTVAAIGISRSWEPRPPQTERVLPFLPPLPSCREAIALVRRCITRQGVSALTVISLFSGYQPCIQLVIINRSKAEGTSRTMQMRIDRLARAMARRWYCCKSPSCRLRRY